MDTAILRNLGVVIAIIQVVIASPIKANWQCNTQNVEIREVIAKCVRWHYKSDVLSVSSTNSTSWQGIWVDTYLGLGVIDVANLSEN